MKELSQEKLNEFEEIYKVNFSSFNTLKDAAIEIISIRARAANIKCYFFENGCRYMDTEFYRVCVLQNVIRVIKQLKEEIKTELITREEWLAFKDIAHDLCWSCFIDERQEQSHLLYEIHEKLPFSPRNRRKK